jgi:hypothetical protein
LSPSEIIRSATFRAASAVAWVHPPLFWLYYEKVSTREKITYPVVVTECRRSAKTILEPLVYELVLAGGSR